MHDSDNTMRTRRSFLTGGYQTGEVVSIKRPPWTSQSSIAANCTSCGDCIKACPEQILFSDSKGQPGLSFETNGCTFCEACAMACDEDVFDLKISPAIPYTANVTIDCLLHSGVSCQICTDSCEPEALRFNMRVRPAGVIELDTDLCSGCGACVSTCPSSAITMIENRRETTV